MDFDKYKNALPYPSESDFTILYWYKGGKVVAERHGREEAIAHVSGLKLSECVNEKVVDKDGLKEARRKYNAETARLETLFKNDLFEELGISYHPMREKLFAKAWEDGHAAGYGEVFNCADNLVELIKLPRDAVLVTKDSVTYGDGFKFSKNALKIESRAGDLQDELQDLS